MTSHPRYPVWLITLMCFNLISRMTLPGNNFHLIPCLNINKTLLFKPTELGHITRSPIFDSRRAEMYTPKQMKNLWDKIIHASASDTVLKKLTRTILTQGNAVRISDPGNLEHLLSLYDRLLMDPLLTPSFSSTNSKKLWDFWDITFNVWETFLLVSSW